MIRRIVDAAAPSKVPLVVEIGPGEGVLTGHLLERADRVVAVELDEALAARLRAWYPALVVSEGDVLETDLGSWGEAVVVGNLPYYITSPIIDRVLSLGPLCPRAVLMMQREVAQRLSAQPGTRDYGFLSVTTQARAVVEYLFTVSAGSFAPPPKVESAVVRLTPRAVPLPTAFLEFASLAFRQKRKTIRNNVSGVYPAISGLPEAGLRAEQLSVAELHGLFQRLVS